MTNAETSALKYGAKALVFCYARAAANVLNMSLDWINLSIFQLISLLLLRKVAQVSLSGIHQKGFGCRENGVCLSFFKGEKWSNWVGIAPSQYDIAR
jgi:hypothetical protein